jgi:curli biogenesis system outer membrane secretion channel CsgG
MKKFFVTVLIFLSLCRFASAQIVENSKIAIMDLGTHEGAVPFDINIFNAGKASSEYLVQRLFEVGKFNVMDRFLVESQIKASNLNTTGIIDPATAKKIGDILGADYLVYGNVNDVTLSETGCSTAGVGLDISTVTVKAHIIVRVMEIKTGKIIGAAKGEGKSKGSFLRIKGGPIVTIEIGRTKVTQDSVHNSLQKAAVQTVDKLIKQLY